MSHLKDPTTQYYTGEYPKQKQPTPGIQARVLAEKADLGIAFDGDGDRVIMVDHEGNKVDGDQIMYIIAREGLRQGQLRGGAVGTLMDQWLNWLETQRCA
eukprot:81008_1